MKKKILFVSVNRHQKRYFATLCHYLENDYEVELIDYSLRHYFDALLPIGEDCPKELTQDVLNKIINFSQRKREIRTDFDRFRKFMYAEKQLIKGARRNFNYFYQYIQKNKMSIYFFCIINIFKLNN